MNIFCKMGIHSWYKTHEDILNKEKKHAPWNDFEHIVWWNEPFHCKWCGKKKTFSSEPKKTMFP